MTPSTQRRQWQRAVLCAALALGAGVPAFAADALNGKSLYLNGPVGGGATCTSCHGASPAANVFGILAAADNPSVISSAWAANKGGMGTLFNGKFTTAEIADLAAFIGNPGVTAAPAATLSPSSLSFSATTVGQSSAALSATLSNSGTATLTVSGVALGGANAADYSIAAGGCASGTALAVGASCGVSLTFKPQAAGTRAATLTISHNASGGSSAVALSGTGNALPQASIAVNATSIDFGAGLVGTASSRSVTVSNGGQAALNWTGISVGGANAAIFTLGGTCALATPLAAGATCTVTVQALPGAAGSFAGTLTLASNAANGSATIGLSGSASAAAPAVQASPSAIAFGSQTIGGTATQNVALSNSGNVALAFSSIAVSGAPSVAIGAGGTCGATLAVGASCNVVLNFLPTGAGAISASLVVNSNAAPLTVAIGGTGTTAAVAQPTLSDGPDLSFANTQVGATSAIHTTTLSNPGSVAFKVASLTLAGANGADFVLGGTCAVGGTVSPGASCTLDTSFKPGAAGARSASVLLVTDGGAQRSLNLAGSGVAVVSQTPSLAVAPQSFDFGSAAPGAAGPSKSFAVTNSGSAAVTLNSVSVSGAFTLGAGGCNALPFVLQPGATCQLEVRFAPAVAGATSGSATILAAGGASWTIAVNGEGVASAAPAASYNTGGGGCSAARDGNDPVLVLLVALALGVLGWRRATRRAVPAQLS